MEASFDGSFETPATAIDLGLKKLLIPSTDANAI
jgi:hypothetical protein